MSNENETGTPAPRMPREVFDVYLEYVLDSRLGRADSPLAHPDLNLLALLGRITDVLDTYIEDLGTPE